MTLDQTFKAYYSSMEDGDLLKLAANKFSFIDVAQRMMTDELERRHLTAVVSTKYSRQPSRCGVCLEDRREAQERDRSLSRLTGAEFAGVTSRCRL